MSGYYYPHQGQPSRMSYTQPTGYQAPPMVPHWPGQLFRFDGSAGDFFWMRVKATLLVILTLGLGYPWAISMWFRWRCEHTILGGRRLRFTGTGGELFGTWIIWWVLMFLTFGIYIFWVIPQMERWGLEHQVYA
ncbi:protein of unknown function [Raineyella antarctica]|uniref:DUF898 family protein n=1 Tax=Raineyella antarctica TaxID=1577474 RepID=A0A1G6IGQ3_9ACTN|nr:DUF898 family protein [Raineyella antarctica]SDC05658.1 protein of unknown function [Raineyella antarctica]